MKCLLEGRSTQNQCNYEHNLGFYFKIQGMVGYFSRTRILSGNQFTRHFIEFVCVKTKRFVSSNRVLVKYLERICHVFLISKCRGLRSRSLHILCTCEKRTAAQCQIQILPAGETSFSLNLAKRSGSLFASTQKVNRFKYQSPLHFDIGNIWQICLENNSPSARCLLPADMHERWPHRLPRQDHIYITNDELFRFHKKNSIKCIVNWVPLRVRVRSRNTQPHLHICSSRF